MNKSSHHDFVTLSLAIAARDEEENIKPLVDEIERNLLSKYRNGFELLIVDDGSTDETLKILSELASERSWLRVLHLGGGMGQSAALYAGIQAATSEWIATLDADLQNDPADIGAMLDIALENNVDMVQGDRSRNRRDNIVRRFGSLVGRAARRALIGDSTRDTGCSARVMRSGLAKSMPLTFNGMHRFFPAVARFHGFKIIEFPVNHRVRVAGRTKYGMGILTRALPGLMDCFAVRWMKSRYLPVLRHVKEVTHGQEG